MPKRVLTVKEFCEMLEQSMIVPQDSTVLSFSKKQNKVTIWYAPKGEEQNNEVKTNGEHRQSS